MENEIIDTAEDYPVFSAIGRVARAITHPIIGEYDLSLLELNALATISHVHDGYEDGICPDTIDAMFLTPGCGQSFDAIEQFETTFKSLAEKGLVSLETLPVEKLRTPIMFNRSTGVHVHLLKEGHQLLYAMASNLGNALDVLDKPEVREGLEELRT